MKRLSCISAVVGVAICCAFAVHAESMSLVDSAFVRGGANADTSQVVTNMLELKNSGEEFCRIGMMKADVSSLAGTVSAATFSFYETDGAAHTLYIYGVKDSASFQNWTGDSGGSATWNSVTANGLFTPKRDLYGVGDPNLILLGTETLPGANAGDVQVSVSGAALVSQLNSDTDGLLTFVFAIAENVLQGPRPHDAASAPSLDVTYGQPPAPVETMYPLYPDADQLYSNAAPYDLSQETYAVSEIWRTTAAHDTINFLPNSYNSPIATRGDSTYVVYVDVDHRVSIVKITDGVTETAFVDKHLYEADDFYSNIDPDVPDRTAPDYYRVRENDSHHAFAMGIDENGYIHLAGDMHNYPVVAGVEDHLPIRYVQNSIMYWRSDNPGDISSFSYMGDQQTKCPQGTGFSYSYFFNDMYGKLHYCARAYQLNTYRCAAFSRYDASTGDWSIIGGPVAGEPNNPRTFWEDGAEKDPANASGYSKTYPHGAFDRQNGMHLVAPLMKDDIDKPSTMGDDFHFITALLYAQSQDGGASFTQADGISSVDMPASLDLTANPADSIYTAGAGEYLNMLGTMAVDYQNNPYTVVQQIDDAGVGMQVSSISGWNGSSWVNYGEYISGSPSEFRLVHDPAGVMSMIADEDTKLYRFWHPTDPVHEVDTLWKFRTIDYEYLKKTGNIMGVAKLLTGELLVGKIVINRPGMSLLHLPADPVTNNIPEITVDAAANPGVVQFGTPVTLSVSATDADSDPLTYTWFKHDGYGDVAFSENGTANSHTVTATFSAMGFYELKVAVSDGTSTRIATCGVSVWSSNTAPTFNSNPLVELSAAVGVPYSSTLADDASDADSDPLTYSVVSGPAWLNVASDGALSGTPISAYEGLNIWTVRVSDGNGGMGTTQLNITVAAAGSWVEMAFDDFESGWGNWVSGGANATLDTGPNAVGTQCLEIEAAAGDASAAWLATSRDLTGFSDLRIEYTYMPHSFETGENFLLQFSDNGGASWSTIRDYVVGTDFSNDVREYEDLTITDAAYNFTSDVKIRFECSASGAFDDVFIDDVRISAKPGGPVNNAPVFSADPINKANATEEVGYGDSIAGSATDAESDPLTYSKVSGPAWLSVAADGVLSGTPANGDVGLNAFTVQVAATGGSDTATLNITVINVNDAPVFSADPINESDASENVAYSASVAGSATDVDAGDTLTYSKVSGPAWLSVAANGALSGTPGAGDLGANVFSVKVEDAALASDTATLNITVTTAPVNQAPAFTIDPFSTANATENAAYSASIAGDASDPESDPMTFSKVSGPTWLSVATDGTLSGTPIAGDVGPNAFTVQVDATGGSDTATLNITVDEDSVPLPGIASSPSPATRARNVSNTPTLSWVAGSDAVSHNVYFGTVSGSPAFMGNQTGTTFAPGTLANKVKYYWRIDEVNAAGTTTGTQWSFTTVR